MIDIFQDLFRSPPPKPQPDHPPMRTFNAFQIVALFSAFPYLIQWLITKPFENAEAAYWAAIVAYVVSFLFLVGSVRDSMRRDGPFGWF